MAIRPTRSKKLKKEMAMTTKMMRRNTMTHILLTNEYRFFVKPHFSFSLHHLSRSQENRANERTHHDMVPASTTKDARTDASKQ